MHYVVPFLLLLITILSKTDAQPGNSEEAVNDTLSQFNLSQANNRFTFDLYSHLRLKDGNLFLSPYSLFSALAMTYAGARETTEKQMAQALHFPLTQSSLHTAFSELQKNIDSVEKKGKVLLSIANSLFLQKGYEFKREFIVLTRDTYDAAQQVVDFKEPEKARRIINAWVEKETREKIEELIKPGVIDDQTRLALVNAIYFKGSWARQFDTASTAPMQFYRSKHDSVRTPFMCQKAQFNYYEDSRVQILEMPYEGEDVAMVFLLPQKKNGLSDLKNIVQSDTIQTYIEQMQSRKVNVTIPKFKVTSEFKLNKVLAAMGMKEAFTTKADFTGMAEKKELFISAVVHKAFVEIDEEGTEAAASSAVIVGRYSAAEEPPEFTANHPFLFLIREIQSGTILFCGRITDPSKQE